MRTKVTHPPQPIVSTRHPCDPDRHTRRGIENGLPVDSACSASVNSASAHGDSDLNIKKEILSLQKSILFQSFLLFASVSNVYRQITSNFRSKPICTATGPSIYKPVLLPTLKLLFGSKL
ncbi:hypothetical protein CHS0354_018782 [Potamilus streckersoni]|uniref:Uncharacterized protein n=1 Tax=Potamilus streckersoni TaxID=2493646 RepID=A0AAE0TCD9_9BIVA|nr:hypothetical protein CHS0354_018782 [Potamilus streckersoni]